MPGEFNCPNCGGTNEYAGESDTVRCQYCGREVAPPHEMVSQAKLARISSKAKVWIVLFVLVVFVLPTCIGFWGALAGIAASIIGTLAAIFASFTGG